MRALCILACFAITAAKTVDLKAELRINSVTREIDATTQLVKEKQVIEIENAGSRSVPEYVVAVGPGHADNVAFVGAKRVGEEKSLKVDDATVAAWQDKTKFFTVNVGELKPGAKAKLELQLVYSHLLSPYPAKISQAENQNVVLDASATIYSPYTVVTQKASVKLSSSNVHSYSKDSSLTPATQDAATVTYGPYQDIPKFTWKPYRIHFENNSPFLTITRLHRLIEVSHWGNIAVEETIDLYHSGAKLKGSFSRYDFQRDHRPSAPMVKSFRTLLPATAGDVYYRDEIGNISTSNLREHEDSTEIEVRPRFPLFGGWKTHYVIGYNVPSYVYLFRKGKSFALKMRFIDLIFNNFVVDEVTTEIILPERSSNVKLSAPFAVQMKPKKIHYTYLDYTGRPVVGATKKNVVDNHIQDFVLEYTFDTSTMLIEPLMVVGAFFALFFVIIFYVRLDFTIAKDAASESRLKVEGMRLSTLFFVIIFYVRLDFTIAKDAASESRLKVEGMRLSTLFFVIIFYVRLDFTIAKDAASESRLKVEGMRLSTLFFVIIFYVRLDFTIAKDAASESRLKVEGMRLSTLFFVIIFYVRLDFTIAKDAASESRLKVEGMRLSTLFFVIIFYVRLDFTIAKDAASESRLKVEGMRLSTLFFVIIFYVRLDFTIAKDAASESRLKVEGTLDNIRSVLDERAASYDALADAVDSARQKKDLSILQTARKKSDQDWKKLTQQFTDMCQTLRQDNTDVADRMNEIGRIDKQIREQLGVWVSAAERVLGGKGNKSQYTETEKNVKTKIDELKSKIEKIAYSC